MILKCANHATVELPLKRRRPFIIAVIAAGCLLVAASGTARAEGPADTGYWNLLLHYQKGPFGGLTSEARSPEFFLSPSGPTDPRSEMEASLRAIEEKTLIRGQHFECVFPARYHYLKSLYSLRVDEAPCPKLKKWKEQFGAESVSVIFASAYLGNVASTFGHTFLKINSKPGVGREGSQKGELLDLGLSFAAKDNPNDNPITFAWKGLTGGYLENLSIMTYFTRLGEYHNIENRDVWEYRLKVTPAEADRLIEHVWEIRDPQMRYYFTNKNCAYHLWVLLEVAHPEWHVTEPYRYWALPTDGMKTLAAAGAIADVKYRPSIYHKLKQKVAAMSADEYAAFAKSRDSNLTLYGGETGLTIEALLDDQQFMIRPIDREMLPGEKAKQDELFQALIEAKVPSPPFPALLADSRPDRGHPSKKISLIGGSGQADNYAELELRPSLHDLLDNDEGYTPFSQIEVARTRVRVSANKNEIELKSFDLVDIVSLTPMDSILKAPSWLIEAGALVPPDSLCDACLSAVLRAGVGASRYLLSNTENLVTFGFLKLNLEAGSGTPGNFRWGPSELFGFDVRLSRKIKLLTEIELSQYLNQYLGSGPFTVWTLGASWSAFQNFELRAGGAENALPNLNYISGNLAASLYF